MSDGVSSAELIGSATGRSIPSQSEKLLCVVLQGKIFGLW